MMAQSNADRSDDEKGSLQSVSDCNVGAARRSKWYERCPQSTVLGTAVVVAAQIARVISGDSLNRLP